MISALTFLQHLTWGLSAAIVFTHVIFKTIDDCQVYVSNPNSSQAIGPHVQVLMRHTHFDVEFSNKTQGSLLIFFLSRTIY